MKTCGECGDKKMRYCFCLKCGWMSLEDKKKDEKLKKRIEEGNSKKPYRIKLKTARLDWSKFSDNRVLSKR